MAKIGCRKGATPSPKQVAAREYGWLLFQLRGAKAAFNYRNINLMTPEEQKIAGEISNEIQRLVQKVQARGPL